MENRNYSNLKAGFQFSKLILLFWMLTCFLGSFSTVFIERFWVNQVIGFHMSISDALFISVLLTIITMLISFPVVCVVNMFLKRKENKSKWVLSLLLALFVFLFVLVYVFSGSVVDTLCLVGPFLVFTIVFGWMYVKMYRSYLQ